MKHGKSPRLTLTLALTTVLLGFGLAGCAPEAGDVAGTTEKDVQTINPESEASEREVTEYEYTTDIPESFPTDEFSIPQDAVILDIGESGVDQWFVVLHAPDNSAAETWWNEIIETNALSVSDESETQEGGAHAFLTGVTLQVEALTIPQSDESVQLSYSLTRWA